MILSLIQPYFIILGTGSLVMKSPLLENFPCFINEEKHKDFFWFKFPTLSLNKKQIEPLNMYFMKAG